MSFRLGHVALDACVGGIVVVDSVGADVVECNTVVGTSVGFSVGSVLVVGNCVGDCVVGTETVA